MRLGIDVDGVLADFNHSFIDKAIEVTGEDRFPPRPFDIQTWNYPEHYGYTDEQVSATWNAIKQSETFWKLLPLYPWTQETLDRLYTLKCQGHDIYFPTSRVGKSCKFQTESWLSRLGFKNPTVLVTSRKGYTALALDLDTYIDDNTENCQDVVKVLNNGRFVRGQEFGHPVYMLAQPWNTNSGLPELSRCKLKRIGTPLQMLDEITGHAK